MSLRRWNMRPQVYARGSETSGMRQAAYDMLWYPQRAGNGVSTTFRISKRRLSHSLTIFPISEIIETSCAMRPILTLIMFRLSDDEVVLACISRIGGCKLLSAVRSLARASSREASASARALACVLAIKYLPTGHVPWYAWFNLAESGDTARVATSWIHF
jgi:hypothetical protein